MQHLEFDLQKAICRYLSYQYPDVEYMSDTIANLKLTAQQASRNKAIQKNGFKCPDLIILEPRNGYHGLFIELKLETPFKKDGSIKASANDHLKGHADWETRDFLANFVIDMTGGDKATTDDINHQADLGLLHRR